ncbi:IucA/IucC family C-terminal-domain containing protein [Cytobacillus sp. NCCP-133]|uniref:IucA/IucC family C-terminal-domain containing protein n=1 Tax=Cytobacillus sp. NCCP-133 TaxID=766848 RepID=UPI00223166AB|nr:IucA/IucC family C-terminal-domain containing protein [Cytobacillus sp. NCCP-133]GLB59739.1 hypothetical protein NCCP133_18710 [Cytobacillus sp. NCCP-133]
MMVLTEKQAEALQLFRLADHESPSFSIEVTDLLDPGKIRGYLQQVKQLIGANDEKTAASILIKRYAFLPVIFLYSMTSWNLKLDISHENLVMESREKNGLWLPNFRFKKLIGERAGKNRDQWREEVIRTLFSEHVFPIVDCVAKEARISKLILWENIAIYVYWLYETIMPKETAVAKQAVKDFKFIIEEASCEVFGGYHANPLGRFYNEKIFMENKENMIRPRKTCCFSYLTDSGKRCGPCPLTCRNRKKEE